MRLLFYADGRSPITLNWLRHWMTPGYEVHLVSSYPCAPVPGLASLQVVPVAFSKVKTSTAPGNRKMSLVWGADSLKLRMLLRQWFGPMTLPAAGRTLRAAVERIQPDLVHAMRIPYEGMTAAAADLNVPLLISVWGNDFSLHARSSPWMAGWTRRAMRAADGLHSDCRRDVRLAGEWGYQADRPTLVIPGNGGIDASVFHQPAELVQQPVVINPRGFRGYVRNDTFFRSIPLVLKHIRAARFLCSAMADEPAAQSWVTRLGISQAVQLLPVCSHAAMADIFRSAAVLVSPSTHDGTPNSVLEGMACGCFPIAGKIESLQEWITSGQNGLLVDPSDPVTLAQAILAGLTDLDLRLRSARENAVLLSERADYEHCMAQANQFYQKLASFSKP
jgi:glycosyltransferase involved in cell wall biosynthesis